LDIPLKEALPIIQNRIMSETTYFGVRTFKNPLDAWIYQEIIFEVKPDIIIELGNSNGGSTLLLAHLCDLMGNGRVIGIDLSHEIVPESVKKHPRIIFIVGDACNNFNAVKRYIHKDEKVLVIEDSSHTFENTLNILKLYSTLVTKGSYIIIEDSICHHSLELGPNPGPYEAIEEFIKGNNEFIMDRNKEAFLITCNPKGYLRKL
jgi:cephalosporin hydroxylase